MMRMRQRKPSKPQRMRRDETSTQPLAGSWMPEWNHGERTGKGGNIRMQVKIARREIARREIGGATLRQHRRARRAREGERHPPGGRTGPEQKGAYRYYRKIRMKICSRPARRGASRRHGNCAIGRAAMIRTRERRCLLIKIGLKATVSAMSHPPGASVRLELYTICEGMNFWSGSSNE